MARTMAWLCGMVTPRWHAMGLGAHWCLLTLETGGNGEVHGPADQRHDQPQKDEEDPVLTHLGDEEPLALQGADCRHKGRLSARHPEDGLLWGGGARLAGTQALTASLADPALRAPSRAGAPSQPCHSQQWAGMVGSGRANAHKALLGMHLPLAWPQAEGLGAPTPCGMLGYFGPLCPCCPAGRWHCPRRRCPMTARETLPDHSSRVGSLAQTGCCPPAFPSPVALTTAGSTATLGVLQQLRGPAGPGGVAFSISLLQPQPSCLVLGEGAQVLCVASIHLGEERVAIPWEAGTPAPVFEWGN